MSTFSPTEAISFGWKTFKANVGFSLGLIGILFVVELTIGLLTPDTKVKNFSDFSNVLGTNLALNLIGGVVTAVISLGVIKALLNLVDKGKGSFEDIFIPFKETKILINYILAIVLVYLVVLVGATVGVVLGIITFGLGFLILVPVAIFLSVRFSLFSYYIIDKAINPIEALKASWYATKGNFWNLIGFYFLSILVIFLGALALIVGLFAAIPVVMIATIYVYRKLGGGKPSAEVAQAKPIEEPVVPTPEPAAGAMPQNS